MIRPPTIAALAPRIAEGAVTAQVLLADSLARIEAHDRRGAGLAAILQLNPDAEADAQALDAERVRCGVTRGLLHGMPIVVKDNIDVAGLPTTSGNRAMAGAIAARDAEQVRRLRQAGAVIVAKTNLSEFSFEIRSRSSLGGDVLNPFNRTVTAGGSSGGTAAAIAAGFAVAGLGTDTGGSIRTPSSYNGLVGLRPTHGLLDIGGVAPLAPSTDTVGPMARSVADLANLLAVMSDKPRQTWLPASPRARQGLDGARIGVLRQAFGQDREIQATMAAALETMAHAGAILIDPAELEEDILPINRPHVVDWEFAPAFDAYLRANFAPGLAPASVAALHAAGDYLPDYRDAMGRRAAVTSLETAEYRAILDDHRQLKAALSALMRRHWLDALVYPTSAVIPTSLANPAGGWAPELAACSGWPALTLPVGQAASGVPIGLELLSRAHGEATLISLAEDLERRLGLSYAPDLDG